jgi:toxin ParE1/3/4
MRYVVRMSGDAERDTEDILRYIANTDSASAADHVLGQIEKLVLSLDELPDRGNVPKELAALGIRDYRELHFKPYRVIYRVEAETVTVYLVADGRRDMRSLLERRLLR